MEKIKSSRRTFIKSSAIGAAGLAAGGLCPGKAYAASSAWTDKKQIHPEIDNMRVAMVKDMDMLDKQIPDTWEDTTVINACVNRDAVHLNLDAMARYLAQEATPGAWAAIFRKPSGKSWGDVKVLLKVNCIAREQQPRAAIIEKVCMELKNLGVPYANMIIFDAGHNADKNTGFRKLMDGNGIPAGVKLSNYGELLGGFTQNIDNAMNTDGNLTNSAGATAVHIPEPFNGTSGVVPDIADGKFDILVNFAVNKGHSISKTGGTTLSMKNHYGTFYPKMGHETNGFDYLIGINKSDLIVGGNPPLQQLVIVDSIWGMTQGPTGSDPDALTGSILMGTFGPAVDYAAAKIVREEEMDVNNHNERVEQFLTSFGYSEQERDDFITKTPEENDGTGVGLVSKDYDPVKTGEIREENTVYFHLLAASHKARAVKVNFPASDKITAVDIFTVRGKLVRKLNHTSFGSRGIVWDRLNSQGSYVSRGTYLVTVKGRSASGSCKISVK